MYKKMMIGFLVIIIVMSAVNGYILYELNTVTDTAKLTLTSDVRTIDIAKQLETILYDEESYAKKFVISHDNNYFALFTEKSRRFEDNIESLYAIGLDTNERKFVSTIDFGHKQFVEGFERQSRDVTFSGYPGINRTEIGALDSLDGIHEVLDQLIRTNQQTIETSMGAVGATTGRSSNVALVLTTCVILGAVTFAFIITRTVTRPIEILKRGTEQIARGSFNPIKVTSNDEFAHLTDAFNDMGEKLKSVNERKAEMMQRISHELRTPLQALLSAHFLLTEERLGPINPQQARILESIRESINKLTNFSNQFLDIAKVEAGMMEYTLEKVDLVSLVQPIVDDARLIAVRKDIRVDLTHAPVPPVLVDIEKVNQVVTNLVSNAIKYTPKSGNIILNVGPSEFGVRIAVQDSGVGIAPEDVPKIFEKFYQAKNAGKAGVKGTGLGLALVKALTEGHGGMVSVSSTVGVGTTFIVEFPAVEAEKPGKKSWKPIKQAGTAHA